MKLWDLGKRRSTSNTSSSWYSSKEWEWGDGQKIGPKLFQSVSENVSRSFCRLNLFIFDFHSWELAQVQNHRSIRVIWQIGSRCHCISKKIPSLELNLKQYNNIGEDLLYHFCFGFWNKPLVWNNCCQTACICTDSYYMDPFQDGKQFATNRSCLHCTMTW